MGNMKILSILLMLIHPFMIADYTKKRITCSNIPSGEQS